MKLKILPLISAIILSAGISAYAEESGTYPASLTLEQATEYALKNHSSVIASESNIAQNEAKVKEAYDSYAKNRYNSFANGFATFNDVLIKNGVTYLSANTSLEIAKASHEQTVYGIKMGVESAYIGYINAVKKTEITSEALESAKSRYQNELTEKELGMSSDYEIMVAENTLARMQSEHNGAMRASDMSLARLKTSVGLPISATTSFGTATVKMPDVPAITLEEAIKLAKQNNLSIKSAKLQSEIQEATFKATASWYSKNTYAYKNAESALEYSRDSYTNALAQAEMNVYTAYDNMLTVIDNAAILRSSVALAERTYEINQQKFELGMIAKLDLDESWYEMQSLKIQQAELDNAVYAAIKQFEMSYTY